MIKRALTNDSARAMNRVTSYCLSYMQHFIHNPLPSHRNVNAHIHMLLHIDFFIHYNMIFVYLWTEYQIFQLPAIVETHFMVFSSCLYAFTL